MALDVICSYSEGCASAQPNTFIAQRHNGDVQKHVPPRENVPGRTRALLPNDPPWESNAAADAAGRIPWRNVAAHFVPCRLARVPGLVPREGCTGLMFFVVKREIVFNLLEGLARMFRRPLVTHAVGRSEMLVGEFVRRVGL